MAPRILFLAISIATLILLFLTCRRLHFRSSFRITGIINTSSGSHREPPIASTASAEALRLYERMTLDEKIALLHGAPGPYVGNVPANTRLKIPAINLNDGPQGFRSSVPGTSTAWPCALSMAATWDETLVFQWGQAMADEFLAKGSNVFLGPGVNVIRIPNNGRNFEYLSGEDPLLGSRLVAAEIKGLQGRGVIANVKHFIHNNQETNRRTVDQVVDERTRWELYMPPFTAAIEAGVLSIMCSYNKVNGEYACENTELLVRELKQLNSKFHGFVVSDWGATHSTELAANAGLDMEMPGDKFFGNKLKEAVLSNRVSMENLNDKVHRVLFALIASGSMTRPSHGSEDLNVTSDTHNQLARQLAANGIVLLKNDDNRLPLRRDQKIHVVGDIIPCGQGSGYVDPPYEVSGFEGIKRHVKEESLVTRSTMVHLDYDSITDADVVVIFTSTTSGEGSDRPNLSFPSEELEVIDKIISVAIDKVIIVGTTPGAVMVPFADRVPALLLAFMPGQEGGNAVADILFGDVNPSGKLPLTLPNVENETNMTPEQYPGINLTAIYSEKLLTGYRWYDAHHVQPKYAFGFGLSYTQFQYSNLVLQEQISSESTAVSGEVNSTFLFVFTIKNTGSLDGREVWQSYVSFPESAGEPPKILKRFGKLLLPAGSSANVSFELSSDNKDLAIWDVDKSAWQTVLGPFTVWVGPSSDDLPLHWKFENTPSPSQRQPSSRISY